MSEIEITDSASGKKFRLKYQGKPPSDADIQGAIRGWMKGQGLITPETKTQQDRLVGAYGDARPKPKPYSRPGPSLKTVQPKAKGVLGVLSDVAGTARQAVEEGSVPVRATLRSALSRVNPDAASAIFGDTTGEIARGERSLANPSGLPGGVGYKGPASSGVGAFARAGAKGLGPAATGLAAGELGAGIGGAAAGLPGAIVGGVGLGLAGGLAGEKVLDALQGAMLTPQDRKRLQALAAQDVREQPVAAVGGNLAAQAAFLRPSAGLNLAGRGIGAGIGGALSAPDAARVLRDPKATPEEKRAALLSLGGNVAMGALLDDPNALGRAIGARPRAAGAAVGAVPGERRAAKRDAIASALSQVLNRPGEVRPGVAASGMAANPLVRPVAPKAVGKRGVSPAKARSIRPTPLADAPEVAAPVARHQTAQGVDLLPLGTHGRSAVERAYEYPTPNIPGSSKEVNDAIRAATADLPPRTPFKERVRVALSRHEDAARQAVDAGLVADATSTMVRHQRAYPDIAPPEPVSPVAETPAPPEPAAEAPVVAAEAPARVAGATAGVREAPASSLAVDAQRFQYKQGREKGTGATGSIASDVPFNPRRAGILDTWVDPDTGTRYVVNGHNRRAKALASGDARVRYEDLPAKDANEARIMGALLNIGDGRGTATDAARLFRDAGVTPEQLRADGISLSGRVASEGLGLSRLAPSVFRAVETGAMSEARGAIIGNALPGDAAKQMAVVKMIERAETRGRKVTDATLSESIRLSELAPVHTDEAKGGGLFDDLDPVQESLALDVADLSAWARREIGADAAAFKAGANKDRAARLNARGNVVDAEKNAVAARDAEQILDVYDRLSAVSGPVRDALNNAALDIKKGKKQPDVRARLLDDIRRAVQTAVPGAAKGGTVGGGRPAEGAAGEGSNVAGESGTRVAVPGDRSAAGPDLFDQPAEPATGPAPAAPAVETPQTPARARGGERVTFAEDGTYSVPLQRGDILSAGGKEYVLDRRLGFMLGVDELRDGRPYAGPGLNLEKTEVTHTGRNLYEEQQAAAKATPPAPPIAQGEAPQPERQPSLKERVDAPARAVRGQAEAATTVRYEAGKALSPEQKRDVLKKVGDSYKDLGAPKVSKGTNAEGEEIFGYVYDPEYMYRSDITGRPLRNYVTLPDGKKAHPSELFPNITQAEVDRAVAEQQAATRKQEYLDSRRDARVSPDGTKADANARFGATGRDRVGSYFAQDEKGRIVRVDGNDAADVSYFERQGFKPITEPVKAEGAEGAGQKRAATGGEYGPNGEWYPGGAFIATSDMPKMQRQKLDAAKGKKYMVEPYRYEVVPAGKFPIAEIGGVWQGNIIRPDLSIDQIPEGGYYGPVVGEARAALQTLRDRYQKGDRFLTAQELYALPKGVTVPADAYVKMVADGEAIPGDVRDRLPDNLRGIVTPASGRPPRTPEEQDRLERAASLDVSKPKPRVRTAETVRPAKKAEPAAQSEGGAYKVPQAIEPGASIKQIIDAYAPELNPRITGHPDFAALKNKVDRSLSRTYDKARIAEVVAERMAEPHTYLQHTEMNAGSQLSKDISALQNRIIDDAGIPRRYGSTYRADNISWDKIRENGLGPVRPEAYQPPEQGRKGGSAKGEPEEAPPSALEGDKAGVRPGGIGGARQSGLRVQYPNNEMPIPASERARIEASNRQGSGLSGLPENDRPAARRTTETPAFKSWFGGSKVVDASGQPVVVYHGTRRPDRIGVEFRKDRATSGPMQYFTDSPAIASNYAESKADTSLEWPEDYRDWFVMSVKGRKAPVNLQDAWWHLEPAKRQELADKLPRVAQDEDTGAIRLSDSPNGGLVSPEHWKYELRQARGNALEAAKEVWLNSGTLINDESVFLDVLKEAGVTGFRLNDPNAAYPAVYPVYLAIKNPIDTQNIPESVLSALEAASRRTRVKKQAYGADAWDKNLRDPREWVAQLQEDYAKGENSFVWTSVPDWVTKTLTEMGYDGIADTGGKMGGDPHTVWVPFEPTQIKSATGNKGTFSPEKKSIVQRAAEGEQRGPSATLTDRLDAEEARILARIHGRTSRTGGLGSAGGPKASDFIENLPDYAALGVIKIQKGAVTLKQFGDAMIAEFGEAIRPHVERIYAEARRLRARDAARLAQTRTPEFKKWFRGSKIVDENGQPKVLYHGTPGGGYTKFRGLDKTPTSDERLAFGAGVYITDDPVAGAGYTRPGASWGNAEMKGTPQVYEVYARLKKPFDLDADIPLSEAERILGDDHDLVAGAREEGEYPGREDLQEDLDNAQYRLDNLAHEFDPEEHRIDPDDYEDGTSDPDYIAEVNKAMEWEEKSLQGQIDRLNQRMQDDYAKWQRDHKEPTLGGREVYDALVESTEGYADYRNERRLFGGDAESIDWKTEANAELRKLGYDAITHHDRYNPGGGEPHQAYVVFDPKALKSAEANRGTFSKRTADIYERAPGAEQRGPSPTLTERLSSQEQAVLGRIKEKERKAPLSLAANAPEHAAHYASLLKEYGTLGAIKMAKGAVKFADWSAEMVREFGDGIKPHLSRIWQEAQRQHRDLYGGGKEQGDLRSAMRADLANRRLRQAGHPRGARVMPTGATPATPGVASPVQARGQRPATAPAPQAAAPAPAAVPADDENRATAPVAAGPATAAPAVKPEPPTGTPAEAPATPAATPEKAADAATRMRMADIEDLADEVSRLTGKPVPLPARKDLRDNWDGVKERAMGSFRHIQNALETADKTRSGVLSPEEYFVGATALKNLTDVEIPALLARAEQAADGSPEAQKAAAELNVATEKVAHYTELLYRAGSDAGRRLAFQKATIDGPFDTASLLKRARAAAGGKLSGEAQTTITRLAERGRKAKAVIDQRVDDAAAVAERSARQPKPKVFGEGDYSASLSRLKAVDFKKMASDLDGASC